MLTNFAVSYPTMLQIYFNQEGKEAKEGVSKGRKEGSALELILLYKGSSEGTYKIPIMNNLCIGFKII